VDEWRLARRFDDAGRALALGLGYRILGGVAPFLLPWLAVLALVPVFAWTAWELEQAQATTAAVVFGLGLALSAFVVDALQLGYSAAGFELLGVLAVVPLAVYCGLGTPTARGLMARAGAAAALLAVFSLARSANVLAYPGFAAAALVGAMRMPPPPAGRAWRDRRLGLAAAALGLLAVAHFAADAALDAVIARSMARRQQWRQAPSGHDLWITLWQGLGDFDRSKGHVFLDQAGEEAVLAAGGRQRLSARSEAILRDLVLGDIREDPAWFAGILLRRTWATLSLRKLWPWGPLDGMSFAPATTREEGVTDTYYTLTAQADWFLVGSRLWEAPVPLILLPTAALLTLAVVPARRFRWPPAFRGRVRQGALVVACVVLAALGTPVLVTTASGVECQMILVPYLLGAALLAEAARHLRSAP
jgi:hypothetical protein